MSFRPAMRLRLNQVLSSKTARVGDAFTSTVVDPVFVRGIEVNPAGNTGSGKITQVTTSARAALAVSTLQRGTSVLKG
jgi:hypothetical protein